jgi:hypothetical protein
MKEEDGVLYRRKEEKGNLEVAEASYGVKSEKSLENVKKKSVYRKKRRSGKAKRKDDIEDEENDGKWTE